MAVSTYISASNNFSTTLAASLSDSATTVACTSLTGAPTLPYHLTFISANDSSVYEIVKVTATSSNTITTMTRAQEGTTAIAFSSGDLVEKRVTAEDINQFNDALTGGTDTLSIGNVDAILGTITAGADGATRGQLTAEDGSSNAPGVLTLKATDGTQVNFHATGAGELRFGTGATLPTSDASGTAVGSAAQVLPVADSTIIVQGSGDNTKQIRLEADTNISTGTTRVITMADADVDLTANSGTYSAASHASRHVDGSDDIQDATASQKGLMTSAYASKLDGIEAGADVTTTTAVENAYPVSDATILVKDPADSTKRMRLDAGNITTANIRVLTMADQDVDLDPTSGTYQAKDDLLDDIVAITLTKGDVLVTDGTDIVNLGVGSDGQVLTANSAQTYGVHWGSAGGTGSTLPVDDTQTLVRDPADNTKLLRIDVGSVATATTRVWTAPDQDLNLTPDTGDFAGTSHASTHVTGGTDKIRDATASQDGLMTSTFASKLDGIESSADVTDATNVAAAGAVMDSDISEGEGILRKTGAGAYEAIKTQLAGTTAPTATDDTGSGYAVGSLWIDTTNDKTYICVDSTSTAAVWNELSRGETELTGTAREYTKTQNFNATTLSDGANISWDAESNQVASVTLAGNRTLDNPTNMKDGATYILTVKQDGTGSRTLAYGSAYKWPGGTAPTLTTTASAVDIITFVCDGTNMYGVSQLDFS